MRNEDPGHPSWDRRDWIMMLLIGGVGGLVRLVRLGEPRRRVFDEAFYAREGCLYAGSSPTTCTGREHLEVHPPLAKRLIGLGIDIFGYNAVGWRIVAALFGTATILLIYVLARRLLRSTFGASLIAGLFSLDFLHFVMSRVAMLDVFITFFSTAAFSLLAVERDRLLTDRSRAPRKLLLLGIGVSCGAAAASKWSGALTLVACIWLLLAWNSRHQSGRSSFGRLAAAIRQEAAPIALFLGVVPLVVYSASFVGALDRSRERATGALEWLQVFGDRHLEMLNFHRHSIETTIVSSPAWSWPLIRRPVAYFAHKSDERIVEVWFGGNPLIWWPALGCILYLIIRWARRQDAREPTGFIICGFLLLYGPWFLLTIPPFTWDRDLVFIFYLLPALPFMYLALGYSILSVRSTRLRGYAVGAVAATAVAGFIFFYPILSGFEISRDAWLARVRWFADCDRPKPPTLVLPNLSTEPGDPDLVTITLRSDDPPTGWCWK